MKNERDELHAPATEYTSSRSDERPTGGLGPVKALVPPKISGTGLFIAFPYGGTMREL